MIGSRKFSGSSSFLNKFQRSASTVDSASDGDGDDHPATVPPEEILDALADGKQVTGKALAARFGIGRHVLDEVLEVLLKLRLATEVEGAADTYRLTDMGLRAAGFSKIARK